MSSKFNLRVNGQVIPVIDCTSWKLNGIKPICERDLDLAGCASCSSRTSRNGSMRDLHVQSRPDAPPVPPTRPAPEPAQPMRGLGDVVAAVTTAVGIKPCGGCKQRQAALNRLVPFGGAETPPAAPEASGAAVTPPAPSDAA